MPLIRLNGAKLAFGHWPLLDNVNFLIDPGERVCLVGRNGEGKSTLLRVIAGEIRLDDGEIWRQPNARIAYLEQDVPPAEGATVYDVVASGLEEIGEVLKEYHHLMLELTEHDDPRLTRRLGDLQHRIDTENGWLLEQRVATVLTRLQLSPDVKMSELSGGYKRRVLLGRALVKEPDLLLLDEPTNHLDIESIAWIEEFLLSYRGAVLFITHDRAFLRRLATRIIELDRGKLTSWPGNYEVYLERKQAQLAAESTHNAEFDKKLAAEEVWIRQGVKARRTRNEGRVRALEQLRRERQQRREVRGAVRMQVDRGEVSGKKVVEAEHVVKSFGGKTIIRDLSTTIMRGDRIGIIGPNGAGKTTLIKMLLGDLPPDSGTITVGTKLQVAYFDQQRAQLNLERTVAENITDRGDTILVNGQSRHIISYLQDFLFPPQRARSPVKSLSGGERNRLLLARLFMQPANVLVLDEPTNDLDVETLELLEELLSNYEGTVLVVSHDRAFLDNVVTSTLVFEGNGLINEYVGGYEDWLRQRRAPTLASVHKAESAPTPTVAAASAAPAAPKKKLSFKDQRELDGIPLRIEELEKEQLALQATVGAEDFYRNGKTDTAAVLSRLEEVGNELERAYRRWEELLN